jgi:serine/threonine protein kinase
MVGERFIVKVADFGLARDVHYLHYYRKVGTAVLPVRWMAPESMVEGKFTSETDVWGYGVVLWEIFSGARLPYEDLGNDQVFENVIRGLRLSPPATAPKAVADIMVACFSPARPTFRDISMVLEQHNRTEYAADASAARQTANQGQPSPPDLSTSVARRAGLPGDSTNLSESIV